MVDLAIGLGGGQPAARLLAGWPAIRAGNIGRARKRSNRHRRPCTGIYGQCVESHCRNTSDDESSRGGRTTQAGRLPDTEGNAAGWLKTNLTLSMVRPWRASSMSHCTNGRANRWLTRRMRRARTDQPGSSPSGVAESMYGHGVDYSQSCGARWDGESRHDVPFSFRASAEQGHLIMAWSGAQDEPASRLLELGGNCSNVARKENDVDSQLTPKIIRTYGMGRFAKQTLVGEGHTERATTLRRGPPNMLANRRASPDSRRRYRGRGRERPARSPPGDRETTGMRCRST